MQTWLFFKCSNRSSFLLLTSKKSDLSLQLIRNVRTKSIIFLREMDGNLGSVIFCKVEAKCYDYLYRTCNCSSLPNCPIIGRKALGRELYSQILVSALRSTYAPASWKQANDPTTSYRLVKYNHDSNSYKFV